MFDDPTKYLTVGALIDKLAEYPRDAVILIDDADTGWDAPIHVEPDTDGTVLLRSDYAEMCSGGIYYKPRRPPIYRKPK